MKQALLVPKGTAKKPQQMRSRTILGCDQIGIETLVSMINSGESDSEKEGEKDKDKEKELPTPQTIIKNDTPRVRSMLRKTGNLFGSCKDILINFVTAKNPLY